MANDITINRATGEVVRTNAPAPTWEIEGSMALSLADLRPPLLKIVQGTTRNVPEGAVGQWHLSIDDSLHREFTAVFVGLTNKSRAMFADGVFDRPPVCSSDDNAFPRSQDEAAAIGAGPTCTECPFSRFVDGNAPLCSEAWNFLGVPDDEERSPFLYRATGTAIAAARRFVQPFYFRKRPLFSARVTLTTQRVQDEKGVYYVPVFDARQLEPGEREEWAEQARAYLGFTARADYAEHHQPEPASELSHHQEISVDDLPLPPESPKGAIPETEAELWEELEGDKKTGYAAFKARMEAPSTPRRSR